MYDCLLVASYIFCYATLEKCQNGSLNWRHLYFKSSNLLKVYFILGKFDTENFRKKSEKRMSHDISMQRKTKRKSTDFYVNKSLRLQWSANALNYTYDCPLVAFYIFCYVNTFKWKTSVFKSDDLLKLYYIIRKWNTENYF